MWCSSELCLPWRLRGCWKFVEEELFLTTVEEGYMVCYWKCFTDSEKMKSEHWRRVGWSGMVLYFSLFYLISLPFWFSKKREKEIMRGRVRLMVISGKQMCLVVWYRYCNDIKRKIAFLQHFYPSIQFFFFDIKWDR